MIPEEMLSEEISYVISWGLYCGAAFQLVCLLAAITLDDNQLDNKTHDKMNIDSDECSSEQSSPGHRPSSNNKTRKQDKKKRR